MFRGYTGHINDSSGLIYARARYLEPEWGMFLSEDPVRGSPGDIMSMQGFIYGNANPLRFTDPTGRCSVSDPRFKECLKERSQLELKMSGCQNRFEGQRALRCKKAYKNALFGRNEESEFLGKLSPVNIIQRSRNRGLLSNERKARLADGADAQEFQEAIDSSLVAAQGTMRDVGGTVDAVVSMHPAIGLIGSASGESALGRKLSTTERVFGAAVVVVPLGKVAGAGGRILLKGRGLGRATKGVASGAVAQNSAKFVAYESTDLSKAALAYRRTEGIWGGRNIAVFEYLDDAGEFSLMIKASQRNVGHSERLIAKELAGMGVESWRVSRIYSELAPCMAQGGYCARFLSTKFPDASITHTFEYGATKISRQNGISALKATVLKRK